MKRRTRAIRVGNIMIGGGNPVIVQSMTKTKTHDAIATIRQIKRLTSAGCEMIRVAVADKRDCAVLKRIKRAIEIPLVADIHFDYRLAVEAIDAGIDKIRINPGNIGAQWRTGRVIEKAKDKGIPIRIGVNSGSLPKKILKKYRHPTAEAVAATVMDALPVFEKKNFKDIIISAKCADAMTTVAVYNKLSKSLPYPLHLGITEAGLPFRGGLRSAIGLGILLHKGIGDTIRVSLTADPVTEVIAAYEILDALGLRRRNPVLISCPTCGRCDVELTRIVRAVERRLKKYNKYMKVAVMGCVVNGPGEAKEADFGIACGKKLGLIFARGKEIKRVREDSLVSELFEVIDENIDN
jgi:(E)-4-hydroxy-3-methylbut-2-enyl-diphosphate synthase